MPPGTNATKRRVSSKLRMLCSYAPARRLPEQTDSRNGVAGPGDASNAGLGSLEVGSPGDEVWSVNPCLEGM